MDDLQLPALNTLSFETHADDGVVVLRLDRSDRMNSMTVEMFHEFNTAAMVLRDTPVRALILAGAGDTTFCAGFDLDEIDVITTMGVQEFLHFQETATGGLAAIRALPFPVIAAVQGAAAGGGLALALAADMRLAAPTAKFNAAFVRVGLSVGELGASWHLTRLVGPGMAAEISYTGRTVEADEAERIGLVNRVVPGDELLEQALGVARQCAANSPGGVRMSKRALQRNQEISSYEAALELENRGQALMTRSADMPEALAAFREGRAPSFTGG